MPKIWVYSNNFLRFCTKKGFKVRRKMCPHTFERMISKYLVLFAQIKRTRVITKIKGKECRAAKIPKGIHLLFFQSIYQRYHFWASGDNYDMFDVVLNLEFFDININSQICHVAVLLIVKTKCKVKILMFKIL